MLYKKKKEEGKFSYRRKYRTDDRYIEYLNSLGGFFFFITEQPHPISLDTEPALYLRQLCVVELAGSKLAGLLC